ncbi:MAG: 30S ribosomal protein S11 [Chlorobi bacterium]|nr:30S ribosomal protein S11 [Chlorobiota bacterium]
MARRRTTSRKKKKVRIEPLAVVHIQSTFNNTIVTFANKDGDIICWSSGGKIGYKGTKKSTPYAATLAAQEAGREAYDLGVRKVEIRVKGVGPGREAAIRGIAATGLEIVKIADVTPIPHNGCRPPKPRRV